MYVYFKPEKLFPDFLFLVPHFFERTKSEKPPESSYKNGVYFNA
jgi:hypothetical protein